MQISKIDNPSEIKELDEVFPLSFFPIGGPDDEFLLSTGHCRVINYRNYDPSTQKIINEPPYFEHPFVYTVKVVYLDDEEKADLLHSKKTELYGKINAKRDYLETQGFPHDGLWFQSDERSVARINSTALTASVALIAGEVTEFPDWIAADNTSLPVDALGVLALQASLTKHAGTLHAHARALKARVQAAQTAEDLAAIDITAGWPA